MLTNKGFYATGQLGGVDHHGFGFKLTLRTVAPFQRQSCTARRIRLQFLPVFFPGNGLVVIAFQQLIMLGELPDAWHLAVLVLMPIGTFALGSWFFAKAKGVLLDYV